MSNRFTKGKGLFGSISLDTSGGFGYAGDQAIRKIAVLSIAGGSTAEQDSGFSLPTNGVVHDIWVKITTASTAAGTLSVGLISTTSGDADGFIASLGSSSTGTFYPKHTFTEATTGDIVTGNKRGALLSSHATGTTDLGSWGYYSQFGHPLTAMLERAVSYTWNVTSAAAGKVYIEYTEI
jgi:hypothetical protein